MMPEPGDGTVTLRFLTGHMRLEPPTYHAKNPAALARQGMPLDVLRPMKADPSLPDGVIECRSANGGIISRLTLS